MKLKLTHAMVWVLDQDEALAFWTDKVGMELRADVTLPELEGFRWLAVGPVGQPDISFALMKIPGPPVFEPETAAQLKELVAKGSAGGLFFEVDDIQLAYEELTARGVEFTDPPAERPYGTDSGFRDPSGNQHRMMQSEAST